jgi:hypothetical protein
MLLFISNPPDLPPTAVYASSFTNEGELLNLKAGKECQPLMFTVTTDGAC